MTTLLILIVGFFLVTLASRNIGNLAARVKMPMITGYLIAGAVAGPFILGWITVEDTLALRTVDQVALGFIAFAAGSELYLKEVRSRIKSIVWTTTGQVIATFGLGVVVVYLVADSVPFMQVMSTSGRLAVALLAASILVARSPSSAIAIVIELRARGPFTKTALGVTVLSDAVVILLFATALSISSSLVGTLGFELSLVLRVVIELLLSIGVGYLVGKILQGTMSLRWDVRIKTAGILVVGLGVFWLSDGLHQYGEHYLSLPVGIEPLLTCMVAGFVVVNQGTQRQPFVEALRLLNPLVCLVFFTLVGASLSLDALISLWPIALVLFGIRLVGIMLGSMVGAAIAGDRGQHIRLGWMAYVTQAGIGLGLAKSVGDQFPSFGTEFAAMIIAVIVLSQIVGPPFLKWAIRRVGESHTRAVPRLDEIRDALILGIDDQSLALERQLTANDWKVIMADTDKSHVRRLEETDVEAHYISRVDEESISRFVTSATDAVVSMLGDDEANYEACELVFEKFGVPRLVVRLNDLRWSDKFDELNVRVVEPTSAMINLLDQFVRVPKLAEILLHRDPEHDVVQVTIDDPDIEGLALRDLRLPPNVRLLGISRDGHAIVPQGNTVLYHNDEITLVGEPHDLHAVASRWGY